MKEKYNVKKKGYLKIHVAVDIKSKKILSVKVADDEHIHDSKVLSILVEDVIKSKNIMIDKVLTNGLYDSMIFLDVYQIIELYLELN